jgi:hypothetical protein
MTETTPECYFYYTRNMRGVPIPRKTLHKPNSFKTEQYTKTHPNGYCDSVAYDVVGRVIHLTEEQYKLSLDDLSDLFPLKD